MLGEKLHTQAIDLLLLIRQLGAASVEGDLTYQQVRLMMFISHGKSQSMMSESMLVTPAAISKMIDCLVQKGLVTRRPDEDRRRQVLTFTAAGKKIYNKFIKAVEGKLDQNILLLPVQEQKQLAQGLEVLDKLVSKMNEV